MEWYNSFKRASRREKSASEVIGESLLPTSTAPLTDKEAFKNYFPFLTKPEFTFKKKTKEKLATSSTEADQWTRYLQDKVAYFKQNVKNYDLELIVVELHNVRNEWKWFNQRSSSIGAFATYLYRLVSASHLSIS